MADQRTRLPAAPVLLPWAAYHGAGQTDAADSIEAAAPPERRVSSDGMWVRSEGEAKSFEAASALRRRLPPQLAAAGLPVDPLPTLPAADRVPFDEEAVVGVAVALDILTTITPGLAAEPMVLHLLTESLLYLGELGGAGSKLEALLEHAHSDAGVQRARLARRLATSVGSAAGLSATPQQPTPATPGSVAAALRQIEAAAKVAVHEATLLLQAHAPVDYWLG